jgi:hypothetical protein
MMRSPALQCRGEISFHHLDGQYLFDRLMPARWASTPEPVQTVGIQNGTPVAVLDQHKLLTPSRIDIATNEEESVDIAVRFDNDVDCYGWNNDSYRYGWRNPAWQIPEGRYLIRVSITSGGQSWSDIFRLINDVPRTDFRLAPATSDDKEKVLRHLALRAGHRIH